MNCKKARLLCMKLVDNQLEGKAKELLLSHLSSCPHCRAFYKQTLQLKHILSHLPSPKVSPFFEERVKEKIRAKKGMRIPAPRFRIAKAVTTIFLLIVAITSIWLTSRRPKEGDLLNNYVTQHIYYTMQNPFVGEDAMYRMILISEK